MDMLLQEAFDVFTQEVCLFGFRMPLCNHWVSPKFAFPRLVNIGLAPFRGNCGSCRFSYPSFIGSHHGPETNNLDLRSRTPVYFGDSKVEEDDVSVQSGYTVPKQAPFVRPLESKLGSNAPPMMHCDECTPDQPIDAWGGPSILLQSYVYAGGMPRSNARNTCCPLCKKEQVDFSPFLAIHENAKFLVDDPVVRKKYIDSNPYLRVTASNELQVVCPHCKIDCAPDKLTTHWLQCPSLRIECYLLNWSWWVPAGVALTPCDCELVLDMRPTPEALRARTRTVLEHLLVCKARLSDTRYFRRGQTDFSVSMEPLLLDHILKIAATPFARNRRSPSTMDLPDKPFRTYFMDQFFPPYRSGAAMGLKEAFHNLPDSTIARFCAEELEEFRATSKRRRASLYKSVKVDDQEMDDSGTIANMQTMAEWWSEALAFLSRAATGQVLRVPPRPPRAAPAPAAPAPADEDGVPAPIPQQEEALL
jgi:hypothetical protein